MQRYTYCYYSGLHGYNVNDIIKQRSDDIYEFAVIIIRNISGKSIIYSSIMDDDKTTNKQTNITVGHRPLLHEHTVIVTIAHHYFGYPWQPVNYYFRLGKLQRLYVCIAGKLTGTTHVIRSKFVPA